MSDITEFTNREPKIWDVTKVADVMDHLKRGEKNVIFSEARAVCKLAIRGAERIEEMMSRGIVSGDFATGYNRLLKDALPRRTDQRKLKIICHSEKVFGYKIEWK